MSSATGDRYLIIHGHFYQPPRENPWLGSILPQASAAPYPDWNSRITRECYGPNAQSRLLNAAGRIKKICNNYEYLSFNFGPTLLSWLKENDPDAYARIIEADRAAATRRHGHGPALAQVYNHIIMPLANSRDRLTQIRWGLADFKARFGRNPEGMWLAETAVDLETLRLLAQEGLRFTVLSQTQGAASRLLGDEPWQDVSGGRIDPREPYRVFWGSKPDEYLDVFFYDGPVSRSIAFEGLLRDGATFLTRIEQAFGDPRDDGGQRLVNLATDGESYGHHFRFGDMALAWLFDHLEGPQKGDNPIRLTNYGEYLAMFPPRKEARIFENSSWSCVHGIERWRSDCGCHTGGLPGWNQKWRTPLRNCLDWLRDQLAATFEDAARSYLRNPWQARDCYIEVILADHAPEARRRFLDEHGAGARDERSDAVALQLLESQLMGLYMFTSCGWFFDDISGLEPVQNLRYALRAIELAQPFCGADLAEGLLGILKDAKPNDPEYKSGRDIWNELVLPESLNPRHMAAHWAASRLLDAPSALHYFKAVNFDKPESTIINGRDIKVLAGQVDLHDRRLGRNSRQDCLAVYSGDGHLAVLAGDPGKGRADEPWLDETVLGKALGAPLDSASAMDIWETLLKLLPESSRFSLEDLLPAARLSLLEELADDVFRDLKDYACRSFQEHRHLLMVRRIAGRSMNWMEKFIFHSMGEAELKRILSPADLGRPINITALENLLDKRGLVGASKEEPLLAEKASLFFRKLFEKLATSTRLPAMLTEMRDFLHMVTRERFKVDFWDCQNDWHHLVSDVNFMARLDDADMKLMMEIGAYLDFDTNT